jgi:hypothetical protein
VSVLKLSCAKAKVMVMIARFATPTLISSNPCVHGSANRMHRC